jgi:hypothetical protein
LYFSPRLHDVTIYPRETTDLIYFKADIHKGTEDMRERLQDREMNPESAEIWCKLSFQDKLTLWSIVLQKPPVAQVLKISQHFMQPEG